jgi:hypothetical protein
MIIHAVVYKAKKQNERAELRMIDCSCSDCPLLKKRQCILLNMFAHCRYGKIKRATTPTRRAASYRQKLSELKVRENEIGQVGYPDEALTFIGDYVWLPYPHINLENSLFENKSGFFTSGDTFLEKEKWTPENVKRLLEFVPMAIMGGAIQNYPKIHARLFAYDLAHIDRQMFEQVDIAHNKYPLPEFMRRIKVRIPPGVDEFYLKYDDKKPVRYQDGKIYLTLESPPLELWSYANKEQPVYTTFTPKNDLMVHIKDLDIVNHLMRRGWYLNRSIDRKILNLYTVRSI